MEGIIANSMTKFDKGSSRGALVVTAAAGAAVVGTSMLYYNNKKSFDKEEEKVSPETETIVVAERAPGEVTEEDIMMTNEETPVESKEYKYLRLLKAPKGKLGFYVRMSEEGPVVTKIKPESPLNDALLVGDVIVSVKDVDVRGMTTEEFHGKYTIATWVLIVFPLFNCEFSRY